LIADYELLVTLYKQGKFEERVRSTDDPSDLTKFYDPSAEVTSEGLRFDPAESAGEPRGRMRQPKDLQWAVGCLRESAQALFDCRSDANSHDEYKKIVLYYFRSLSLSYEVDDYFLSVGNKTSAFLINLAKETTDDIEAYAAQFISRDAWDDAEYRELLKQILIVCLCGVNEYYRQHNYDDGIRLAQIVKRMLEELPRKLKIKKGHWHGLVGLCGYVSGKILTAQGHFAAAEQEFLNSVEAYSESVWQKERNFFREHQGVFANEGGGAPEQAEQENDAGGYAARRQAHELSRAVALRRSGLASSFGYGFQALVMGKVKDALRLTSLSRGVVNWNTGKIYSSYVDLIFFSAKRAENSSDRKALVDIQRNLKRCYRVFQDLIPAAHYKYRALFQISLVYHYLARWYREQGMALSEGAPAETKPHKTRAWNLMKAHYYWSWAARHMEQARDDKGISANKRLRAECLAVLGHAWGNLALLEKDFGRDGHELLEKAKELLNEVWTERDQLPQSLCEVGLAKAAVGRATVEYLLSRTGGHGYLDETDEAEAVPRDKQVRDEIKSILAAARQTLHKVILLNQNNSPRVQATAYLRLTELALLQKEAWSLGREYYEEYKKISSQVEHDFCHRWAGDLEKKTLTQSNSFVVTITPGITFDKQKFGADLETYYVDYAVAITAKQIEEDFAAKGERVKRSLSSYLTFALHKNFGIAATTASHWIEEHSMFDRLIRLCARAKDLPYYARQSKRDKRKREPRAAR
jgi:hypothetical protein